ncbi:MAG: YggS family pyridoxal phosphate-dependent enzyme [Steroidobacteraceae bacterium]
MLIGPQISAVDGSLADNLRAVHARIASAAAASGRTEQSITLVAVSKGHGEARVRAAADLGVRDFGESYLQEALAKRAALGARGLTWHFIGRVQANKTRPIAESFDWVHGVDRLRVAERLSAQRPHALAPLQICIEVNVAAEPARAGIAPAEVAALAADIARLPRLQLRGLMCILPQGEGIESNRRAFGALRALLAQAGAAVGHRLDTLSMGMSSDFDEAILEGATLIRIGTALFGARS